jgi:tetratricopeptide (TPR) repeat protein/2-polyprenyl-3-methyl-5-hydroxy-6-metoxy-1,4-benzoquinol methylase
LERLVPNKILNEILKESTDDILTNHFLGMLAFHVGRNDEALKLLNLAKNINPDNTEILYNLSNAQFRAGLIDLAINNLKNVIRLNSNYCEAYSLMGEILLNTDKPEEATEYLSKAIKIQPKYWRALYTLGIVRKKNGDLDKAICYFEQTIAIKSDYADAYINLANCYQEKNKLNKAIKNLKQAILYKSDSEIAYYNLANVLKINNQQNEAIDFYRKAISIKPDFEQAQYNLGDTLIATGNFAAAFNHYRKAYSLRPKNPKYKSKMHQCLGKIKFSSINDSLYDLLTEFLMHPESNPSKLSRSIISALRQKRDFKNILAEFRSNKKSDDIEYYHLINNLSEITLFNKLISTSPIYDLEVEHLLKTLRGFILKITTSENNKIPPTKFTIALALHCFTNEYLYPVSESENKQLSQLEEKVADIMQNGQQPALHLLVVLATYKPLYIYDWASNLVVLEWGPETKELIERLVIEPLKEIAISNNIRSLTPLRDFISKKVRNQYEHHPYPRWIRHSINENDNANTIEFSLKRLPLICVPKNYISPRKPQILIAGCGTGHHPINTSARFKNSNILAVDLSLASLAYAIRKTNEAGIKNIEYSQADILELGHLSTKFDVIESVGVLHHLEDPIVGWRILTDLLKSGGLMKIGLYSKLARQDIEYERRRIKKKGIKSTDDNIRDYRLKFVSEMQPNHKTTNNISLFNDFYSLSTFRDLIFHVQEHTFQISQLENTIKKLGLRFLGFEIHNLNYIKKFKKIYSKNSNLTSLKCWDKFENDNPKTFESMYNFWCMKK